VTRIPPRLHLVGTQPKARNSDAYSAEALAQAFGRLHGRRVRRFHAVFDEAVIEHFRVSVQIGPLIRRVSCNAVQVEADIASPLPRGMQCSIREARHHTRASNLQAGGLSVFIASRSSERVPELIESLHLREALARLQLGEGESLQTVYGVGFVMVAPTLDRIMAGFDAITPLLSAFAPEASAPNPRMPQPLQPISSVISEWGLADPAARARKVAQAHPDALLRLLATARVYEDRVARFLSRTRSPEGETAQAVRAYADAVNLAEARMVNVSDIREPRTRVRPT
jgi:hypothetical protein